MFLLRGELTPRKLDVLESNVTLDDVFQKSLANSILNALPSFIFEEKDRPRTLVLEDFMGYNIIKTFYPEDKIQYILVRIEGKFYSSEEIQKISMKIQNLDIKLTFEVLLNQMEDIFVQIETYDFSRPIKAKLFNILITNEEKSLTIDKILAKIAQLRDEAEFSKKLEHFKLHM